MKGGKAMKKKYTFTIEEKVIDQLDAIVKASKEAGHYVSKSGLIEVATFKLIKEIVAHAQEERKDQNEKA